MANTQTRKYALYGGLYFWEDSTGNCHGAARNPRARVETRHRYITSQITDAIIFTISARI